MQLLHALLTRMYSSTGFEFRISCPFWTSYERFDSYNKYKTNNVNITTNEKDK
jgi:hypothetical protein